MVDEMEVRVRGGGFTVMGVTGLAEGFVAEFAGGASWNDLVFS